MLYTGVKRLYLVTPLPRIKQKWLNGCGFAYPFSVLNRSPLCHPLTPHPSPCLIQGTLRFFKGTCRHVMAGRRRRGME